jgi:hypothetical protein
MPRKTRILHGEDEYLFVESPGDVDGPALLIFARPENARAVAPGRTPTHKSEHGLWVPIARFDGRELLLAPDGPEGLDRRLNSMLPRYADARRERTAQAKNACSWVAVEGRALYALHPAQPSGLLVKLWRDESAARRALEEFGRPGSVQSTGDLREFLELRAEEGFAGALLDPSGLLGGEGKDEVIFFCLDAAGRIQFMKVGAAPEDEDGEVTSALLDDSGRWELYEGEGELDPFADPDAWDRLMVRAFGRIPFLGYVPDWRCVTLARGGEPVTLVDPEGDGTTRMAALFHDPAAADAFRSRHSLGRATLEPVEDRKGFVRKHAARGIVTRLHPGDHRARGGTLWLDGDELVLDGFAGLWRSRDGRTFEAEPEP